jgi:hypothetical protein
MHAADCWKRALVLLEIAKESPEFRDQAAAIARLWLTLAEIEERSISNHADRDSNPLPALRGAAVWRLRNANPGAELEPRLRPRKRG